MFPIDMAVDHSYVIGRWPQERLQCAVGVEAPNKVETLRDNTGAKQGSVQP